MGAWVCSHPVSSAVAAMRVECGARATACSFHFNRVLKPGMTFRFKQKGGLFIVSFFTTALSVTPSCVAGEAKELVIDNSPQRIADGAIKAELRGVRVVTTSEKFLASTPYGVTVPENVVVEAVTGSAELRKTLELWSNDPNDLTFSKIAQAARAAREKGVTWTPTNRKIAGIYCGIPKGQTKKVAWGDLSCDSSAVYNSEAVARLLLNGGLETNEEVNANVNGKSIELVAVRPAFASALIAGNETPSIVHDDGSKIVLNWHRVNDIEKEITEIRTPAYIRDVVFEQNNVVTFGTPVVDAAVGSNFKVPKLISDKYDVYMVQLAMTWRNLPREDLSELGFLVKAKRNNCARLECP